MLPSCTCMPAPAYMCIVTQLTLVGRPTTTRAPKTRMYLAYMVYFLGGAAETCEALASLDVSGCVRFKGPALCALSRWVHTSGCLEPPRCPLAHCCAP